MPQYQDYTELKRFALKYIHVMIGFNADRKRAAQPLKLFREERAREVLEYEEYGDSPGADEPDDETVDVKSYADMEVAAKVEILAFTRAQGFKPADSWAAFGRFVRAPGGRGRTAPTGSGGGQRFGGGVRDPPPCGRADMSCVKCGRKGSRGE